MTIVLCHGFFGAVFETAAMGLGPVRLPWAGYFCGIDDALRDAGFRVLAAPVHPTGGVETRARQLKAQLLRQLRGREKRGPLVLVGHSMGGLDARFLVSHLGMADDVAAVLTIATPHHGSGFADWCIEHLEHQGGLYGQLGRFGLDVSAGRELTSSAAERFNRHVPDAPGVRYFSITAAAPVSRMHPVLRPPGAIIERLEGENDGLVGRASAEWGEIIDHWDIDHFAQINKSLPLSGTASSVPYWVTAVENVRSRLES